MGSLVDVMLKLILFRQAIKTTTSASYDIYEFAGSDTLQIVPTLPLMK